MRVPTAGPHRSGTAVCVGHADDDGIRAQVDPQRERTSGMLDGIGHQLVGDQQQVVHDGLVQRLLPRHPAKA